MTPLRGDHQDVAAFGKFSNRHHARNFRSEDIDQIDDCFAAREAAVRHFWTFTYRPCPSSVKS